MTQGKTFKFRNASVVSRLIECQLFDKVDKEISIVDILVRNGTIEEIIPAQLEGTGENEHEVDLKKKLMFPTFIDIHTHIDKTHTHERSPNEIETYFNALGIAYNDQVNFNPVELTARVDFSLRSAYAHGTSAVRTNVLCTVNEEYTKMVWAVMTALREKWRGKVDLQFVAFVLPFTEFCNGGNNAYTHGYNIISVLLCIQATEVRSQK